MKRCSECKKILWPWNESLAEIGMHKSCSVTKWIKKFHDTYQSLVNKEKAEFKALSLRYERRLADKE